MSRKNCTNSSQKKEKKTLPYKNYAKKKMQKLKPKKRKNNEKRITLPYKNYAKERIAQIQTKEKKT